jgi:hypothetical protein
MTNAERVPIGNEGEWTYRFYTPITINVSAISAAEPVFSFSRVIIGLSAWFIIEYSYEQLKLDMATAHQGL